MLMRRGIEANPNKLHEVIDMRSSTNGKEVQQLTGHVVALSRFLSYACDKAFLFFATLRKNKKLEWTIECDEDFSKIKEFLTPPLILTHPKEDSHLFLYLSVTERAMSSVIVLKIDNIKKEEYLS